MTPACLACCLCWVRRSWMRSQPATSRGSLTDCCGANVRFQQPHATATVTCSAACSKNGHPRRVSMNSTVRSVLYDLAAGRQRPDDPKERIFTAAYRTTARTFERAVARAKGALRDAGKDSTHVDGYTWHGNRHTF